MAATLAGGQLPSMRRVPAQNAAMLDAEDVQAAVIAAEAIAAETAIEVVAGIAGRFIAVLHSHCRDAAWGVSAASQCIIAAPPFFLGGRMSRMNGNIARNMIASSQNTSLNDMIAACCRTMFSTTPFAIR